MLSEKLFKYYKVACVTNSSTVFKVYNMCDITNNR